MNVWICDNERIIGVGHIWSMIEWIYYNEWWMNECAIMNDK